jgi:hypothetical protein
LQRLVSAGTAALRSFAHSFSTVAHPLRVDKAGESVMHGQIIKFRDDLGFGVIRTEDGSRFRFKGNEIRNPNGKLIGIDADFLLETGRAKDIILMHGSTWNAFGSSAHAGASR